MDKTVVWNPERFMSHLIHISLDFYKYKKQIWLLF